MLLLLFAVCPAWADKQDDDYLDIYSIVDQADTLNAKGKTSVAHAKYIEAQWALRQFQQANPGWNTRTVNYRLNYLNEKVAATAEETATASSQPPARENFSAVPAAINKEVAPTPNLPVTSVVKLLDAGVEPRTALRLHPQVGDQQTLLMTLKMAMSKSAAGKELPTMSQPAMLVTMNFTVKELAANGDITYDLVFSDATVATDTNIQPAIATAMKAALAGLRGLTGSGKMSSQGIVKTVEMKLPATADSQLSQTVEQMKESLASFFTPLPEVAVGPDAKWECPTQIKSQGMTIEQTMTYELGAIAGDRLTFHSTVTQTALNQNIKDQSMPGLQMKLNKLTTTGTGSSTVDLARLMPVTGTLAETMETSMTISVGQQKQVMAMKMTMNISLESK